MPTYDKLNARAEKLAGLADKATDAGKKRNINKELKRVSRRLRPLKNARAQAADAEAAAAAKAAEEAKAAAEAKAKAAEEAAASDKGEGGNEATEG